jgi:dimethylargininase
MRLIMRPPSEAMRRALSEHPERDQIDPARAERQHAAYVSALESAGVSVLLLASEHEMPDACFTWDTLVAFPQAGTERPAALLVAARPGEPSRRPEVASVLRCARVLAPAAELVEIREPGTLDGGDVITYGDRVAIGVSARTNEAGARQLAEAVERLGYRAFLCPVNDRLHLASAVSPLGATRLLGTSAGYRSLDSAGPEVAPERELDRIVIADDDLAAANVLVAGGQCFVVRGHPAAVGVMRRAGEKVVEVDLKDFVRADGGPTCLVVPIP